ncbi:GNAT family N-acetyltransferase [Enterococcus lemanii]|uniref:GNAT family N-acetyltransferase n=1 Tax=Enterococcus lemanii TaxID=1159752 RepID=A0ABV9MTG8_9ENTE|nr:GNAT family N-acetyltransferase [Enterococcus lemanii]MBM7709905.1 ribosomal protein S18 acetylase RimI-like enzyme [Enterococcus lemanii]
MEIKKTTVERLSPILNQIFEEQTLVADFPLIADQMYAFAAWENDQVAGGIVAKQTYESLYVQLLAVSPSYRGRQVGSRLLEAIEQIAQEQDLIHITLTTKSYQALDFYLKHGYEVFGEVADLPMRGVTKYYLKKRLKD